MTNATAVPTTYAAAAKVAEEITLAELAELLKSDDNPYIFPKPRARRAIAMYAKLDTRFSSEGKGVVFYDRCAFGTGTSAGGVVTVGWKYDRPVFAFGEQDDVRVVVV